MDGCELERVVERIGNPRRKKVPAGVDAREQGHVLATLSMQIQKVPHTQAVDRNTAPLPFGRAISTIT